jgi:hypothetical protein
MLIEINGSETTRRKMNAFRKLKFKKFKDPSCLYKVVSSSTIANQIQISSRIFRLFSSLRRPSFFLKFFLIHEDIEDLNLIIDLDEMKEPL